MPKYHFPLGIQLGQMGHNGVMKVTIESAHDNVLKLLGKRVALKVNRGRNRIKKYNGVVTQVHPNIFVVSVQNEIMDRVSCSYTDMVCGQVQIKEYPRDQV